MADIGRDYRIANRQMELLERIAIGVEKLSEETEEIQMEVGPPLCPHCQKINPTVATDVQEAVEGPLFLFGVEFHCKECGEVFWALPVQWSMHTTRETIAMEVSERAGMFDVNQVVN